MNQATQDDKLAFSFDEYCQALGIGESLGRRMIADGTIRTIRLGRRLLIPRRALEAFVAAGERDQADAASTSR
jgi:excisionase family DNA binding protein